MLVQRNYPDYEETMNARLEMAVYQILI